MTPLTQLLSDPAVNYSAIELNVDNRVAIIRLNRPSDGNAVTVELATELLDAVTRCDGDPSVRAVIITGAGTMFCVGGDLKEFSRQGANAGRYTKDVTHAFHAAISRMNRMDAPVIAAINGTAAGAGFSLALATDLAVAAESARFTMAYTRAGLSPDGSSTYFLARHLGLRRAKEMALLNPVLSARQAMDWGLLNRVVSNEDVLSTAMELAKELAVGPRSAQGETKRLILAGVNESLETQMESETSAIARMADAADGREGIAAFSLKRPPTFE